MCLAVPMRVARLLPEGKALVRQDNLETVVDTSLVENVRVGDHLIIHAGYAIEILDAAEAEERLALFDEMAAKAPRQDSP